MKKIKEHWTVRHHNNIPDPCKGCKSHYDKDEYMIYDRGSPCTYLPSSVSYDAYLKFANKCPCGICLVKLNCLNINKETCPLMLPKKIPYKRIWRYIKGIIKY